MSNFDSSTVHQRSTFNNLVNDSVYDKDFQHAEHAKSFVTETILNKVIHNLTSANTKIIDCGYGTGAWLYFFQNQITDKKFDFQLFGFDISDKMIEIAQSKLTNNHVKANLKQGDLLDSNSFKFIDSDSQFNLIFTYE